MAGDNKWTVEAIYRRIGVFTENEDTSGKFCSGQEYNDFSISEQRAAYARARLFYCLEPVDKSKIVEYLRSMDEISAMVWCQWCSCFEKGRN